MNESLNFEIAEQIIYDAHGCNDDLFCCPFERIYDLFEFELLDAQSILNILNNYDCVIVCEEWNDAIYLRLHKFE